MRPTRLRFANLEQTDLEKVRVLEEELGSVVLVMEPQRRIANLSNQQIEEIKTVEKKLGVILIAYQS